MHKMNRKNHTINEEIIHEEHKIPMCFISTYYFDGVFCKYESKRESRKYDEQIHQK